jgi:hypothetical protein
MPKYSPKGTPKGPITPRLQESGDKPKDLRYHNRVIVTKGKCGGCGARNEGKAKIRVPDKRQVSCRMEVIVHGNCGGCGTSMILKWQGAN